MKSKKIPKKMLSVILAFMLLVTSMPLIITQAAIVNPGKFDPVPYWSLDPDGATKKDAKEIMFSAVLNADNSIDVYFPRAFSVDFQDGDPSTPPTPVKMMGYIVTLTEVEDGQTNKNPILEMYYPLANVVQNDTGTYARQITIKAEDVEKAVHLGEEDGGFKTNVIYDVGVTAVDNEYWTSETIHTVLNDTPYYNLTGDYSPDENWIAREMLRFEERYTEDKNVAGYELSTDGTGLRNGADYYGTESGTAGINIDGKFPEMGCDNSNSMHFWISGNYTTPFSFTTTWSRGHYNFESAEEVWFYVDFRDVQFDKISFNLRANEKYRQIWRDHTDDGSLSDYGHVAYSTKAAGGANAGVKGGIYFQDEAGLWEETTMTDGCLLNFGGYRGFIRIPLEYFVAQETQYITADNDWGANNYNRSENGQMTYCGQHMFLQTNVLNTGVAPSTIHVTQADGSVMDAERATMLFLNAPSNGALGDNTRNLYKEPTYSRDVFKVPVNKIGTPVTKCLLIQNRFTVYDAIIGNDRYGGMGYMLQEGTKASISNNGDNTMTYNITRDDTATYAIEDLIGAGFEVEGWTDDSVNNSFDIDRIIFMRKADANSDGDYNTDTGAVLESAPVQFPTESGKFATDRGYKVGIYYNRTSQIPTAIANFIDEYLGDVPSLLDYDTIRFIENAVEIYKDCFPNETVAENLAWLGTQYPDEYNKYLAAKAFVNKYIGTGDGENYYQAALLFEQRVELLPDPNFLDMSSDTIKSEIIELMGLYQSFDIGKLDLIGDGTESKFLQIYRMMVGNDINAGHSIGAYPYIPFNNFESRYYLNETAFRYYNDGGKIWYAGTKSTDRNNVGSFTVYGDNEIVGTKGDANGWFPRAYNPASDAGDGSYGNFQNGAYFSRVSAQITANGFNGTKGASVNFDGDVTNHYNVISVSYQGRTAPNFSELPGLNLSALQLSNKSADGTSANDESRYGGKWANSFVMYIDYSHVKDVAMNLQFIVGRGGTDDVFYFATGNTGEDRIWMLNENGDWVEIPINTNAVGSDCSTIMPNDSNPDNSLQGYKGFIRIPLSKFRNSAGERLDNVLDDNLTIKRVHVAFWSDDNTNVGESVTVDGMGFTYDPSVTGRVSADPSAELISDNTYVSEIQDLDKYFAVQTDDATAFAQAVYSLDAHSGKDKFMADYEKAKAMYEALSDYQKSLPDVKSALAYANGYDDPDETIKNDTHDYLALHADYDNLITTDAWASIFGDTSELSAAVAALPGQFKDPDKCTEDNRVSDDVYDYDKAEIKFDFYGVSGADDENIQKAIDAYEKGYMRLSYTERKAYQADTSNYNDLINSYKTALRIRELIQDRENIQVFYDKVIALYPMQTQTLDGYDIPKELQMKTLKTYKVDGGQYTDELDPDIADAILDYYYMSIFAKTMLVQSNTPTAKDQNTALMADALINVYINARTRNVTDVSTGEEYKATHKVGTKTINYNGLPGGVRYYVDMTHAEHEEISRKVKDGEYLSAADLNKIEYLIRQYEAFRQRFQAIDPMYNEYLHLLMPFPSADIQLKETNSTASTDITSRGYIFNKVDDPMTHYIYLAHVWARLNHSVTLRVYSDLKMKQDGGAPFSGEVKFTVDLLDGKTLQDGKYYSDYITNADGKTEEFTNRFNAGNPAGENYLKSMVVTINCDTAIPLETTFEGYIYIEAFDSDDIEAYNSGTLTDYNGNSIEPEPIATTQVPVFYNSSETFYSVTFPATVEVPFKTLTTAANISVLSLLKNGDQLSVNLLDPPDGGERQMKLDENRVPKGVAIPDPIPTIPYKVGDGTDTFNPFTTFTVNGDGSGVVSRLDCPFNIWVDEADWNKSYVNSYIDSKLTFMVEYKTASGG